MMEVWLVIVRVLLYLNRYLSNLIWFNQDERFHHSIELSNNNFIWVPSSMYPYSTIVVIILMIMDFMMTQ